MSITPEKVAKRFLGAWIGNETNQEGIWAPTIDKIQKSLARWETKFPTVEGRKIILQWTLGGMTQYLATVQGTPTTVVKALKKIAKTFVWDNQGNSLVNQPTLCAPIEKGGKKLLDIESRNEAVALIMLRDYLKPSPPTWAPFLDGVLAMQTSPASPGAISARTNMFLQNWTPTKSRLPPNVKEMLRVAAKYKVSLGIISPTRKQAEDMPVWHHLHALPELKQLNNYFYSQILRSKHSISTVGDLVHMLEDCAPDHTNNRTCTCNTCEHSRQTLKCTLNPAKCISTAKEILKCIPDTWNPQKIQANEEINEGQEEERANLVQRHPTHKSLKEELRIFSTETIPPDTGDGILRCGPVQNKIEIYAVGAFRFEQDGDASSAGGAWSWMDHQRIYSTKINLGSGGVPCKKGELAVAIIALADMDERQNVIINFASSTITMNLTKKLAKREDSDWSNVPERALYIALMREIRRRPGNTEVRTRWDIRSHNKAHEALRRAEFTYEEDITGDIISTGIRLSTQTQASLYKAIREAVPNPERRETCVKLAITRHGVEELRGAFPSNSEIWKSIRKPTISKGARGFLWKNLYNAYRIGEKWAVIPNQTQRATCSLCGGEENMEHILLECTESTARTTIWELAEKLWKLRATEWPTPTYGRILGCGMPSFKKQNILISSRKGRNRRLRGYDRLYTILVSESAHLIWKLRCERVITKQDNPDQHHTKIEIVNKWMLIINTRLKMDVLHTNTIRYGKKAISESLVLRTWSGTLQDEQNLADNWIRQSGGLVGINKSILR